MKLLIDMNLSPHLVRFFKDRGYEAIHWIDIGDPGATDREIMAWAKERGYVVVTHDLDFGAILAATEASFPSVVQVRTLDVSPESIGPKLADLIEMYRKPLEEGALIVLDDAKVRVRILPLRKQG